MRFVIDSVDGELPSMPGVSFVEVEPDFNGDGLQLVDGQFVPRLDADQVAQEAAERLVLHKRRNQLLASDWTQLPNAPLAAEQRAAWETYRQALRDITDQPGYPLSIDWPLKPGNAG
ncbi:tail fiber assembly protein [Pseudaquabacterium pictum]|uniref:tail fiber assembly protein n=1 Tax=Pseudaquabacterium pictum TaxID=2315236 RepID=UPI0010F9883C|nr:tail fiber assembly protein [Rubrivivax pictus]